MIIFEILGWPSVPIPNIPVPTVAQSTNEQPKKPVEEMGVGASVSKMASNCTSNMASAKIGIMAAAKKSLKRDPSPVKSTVSPKHATTKAKSTIGKPPIPPKPCKNLRNLAGIAIGNGKSKNSSEIQPLPQQQKQRQQQLAKQPCMADAYAQTASPAPTNPTPTTTPSTMTLAGPTFVKDEGTLGNFNCFHGFENVC